MLNLVFALNVLACAPVQPLGIRFFSIPTGSMEPTVHLGSTVASYRCAYGLSRWSYDGFQLPLRERLPPGVPARGTIIVFRSPSDPGAFWIKRVIGLPGDRVELRHGRLYLNGAEVRREARPTVRQRSAEGEVIETPAFRETVPDGATYEILQAGEGEPAFRNLPQVLAPPGQLYVLGDNRDNSADSRLGAATGWGRSGTVPVEYVFGSVVAVGGAWPFDTLKPYLEPLLELGAP